MFMVIFVCYSCLNPDQEQLKCWIYGENHRERDFPHQKRIGTKFYNAPKAYAVGNVACNLPKIYATIDNF